MQSLDEILTEYDYSFDPSIIATEPASPRDSAKILVYRRGTGERFFDTFANIGKYLPNGAVLVLNDTKVFPARLETKKKTGGKVDILYVGTKNQNVLALSNRYLETGEKVFVNEQISFEVISKDERVYTLRPSFPISEGQKIFQEYGETPIPPYIKNTKLSETQLRERYQTVFAKNIGSVAAPTASLHFTNELIERLKKQGIQIEFVTLHVNLGTFSPLTKESLEIGKLHKEWYEVSEKTANALTVAKEEGRPIIAVGTTAVRTLEQWAINYQKGMPILTGETQLFIRPGDTFKFVDGMITNFHVPKSSLLMLVAAFIGREKLFELYREAMIHDFRFFSFGDGMLLY